MLRHTNIVVLCEGLRTARASHLILLIGGSTVECLRPQTCSMNLYL